MLTNLGLRTHVKLIESRVQDPVEESVSCIYNVYDSDTRASGHTCSFDPITLTQSLGETTKSLSCLPKCAFNGICDLDIGNDGRLRGRRHKLTGAPLPSAEVGTYTPSRCFSSFSTLIL
jgi:hypothetical protein